MQGNMYMPPKLYKQHSFLRGRMSFTTNTVLLKTEQKLPALFVDFRLVNIFIYTTTLEIYLQQIVVAICERALRMSLVMSFVISRLHICRNLNH
jgi:hypothetical protein